MMQAGSARFSSTSQRHCINKLNFGQYSEKQLNLKKKREYLRQEKKPFRLEIKFQFYDLNKGNFILEDSLHSRI